MVCGKRILGLSNSATRLGVEGLFASGNIKAAFRHRLNQCLRASDCGRVCERFVKGPGKLAYCVDAQTGEKVLLYPALEDEHFACPRGRF